MSALMGVNLELASNTVSFSLGDVPMLGNLATGGILGLTTEGAELCRRMREGDVAPESVPEGCVELVEHLRAGGYLAERPATEAGVTSAYLHVTQRCNLSCRFCYSEGDDRNRLGDPSLEELRRALGLLAALGCRRVTISGGEPFLRDDLADVAFAARDAGMGEVVVLTNGLLVTGERLAPLAGAVSCVAIAFDGPTADSPAHLRGRQEFDRLASAVEDVRAAGMEARILPTLHAQNLDDLPRYARLAQILGATLSYSLLTADACTLGDLRLSADQLRALGKSSVGHGLPGDDASGGPGPRLAARTSCGAGVHTLSVAADGTVYPCHMLHSRDLSMGNAFLDAPERVMGSRVARELAGISVDRIEGCSSCEARYLCGGGCRARARMTTGRIDGPDPYCELPRSYYEALGEQLSRRFAPRGGD